jgi:glycosyltransferase involved in cell wall biosynthesis
MVSHGEDGLLTDPSLPSFTNAVLQLLQDKPLYDSMSKKALENASRISSSYCARLMLEVYQDLIDDQLFATRIRKPYKKKHL